MIAILVYSAHVQKHRLLTPYCFYSILPNFEVSSFNIISKQQHVIHVWSILHCWMLKTYFNTSLNNYITYIETTLGEMVTISITVHSMRY